MPPAAGARGALRVLDALVRWYAQPPADDAGLGDRARPRAAPAASGLAPGACWPIRAASRPFPNARWPALAQHHEVVVLLLTDPLETRTAEGGVAVRQRSGERTASSSISRQPRAAPTLAATNSPRRSSARWRTLPARGVRVQCCRATRRASPGCRLLGARARRRGLMQARRAGPARYPRTARAAVVAAGAGLVAAARAALLRAVRGRVVDGIAASCASVARIARAVRRGVARRTTSAAAGRRDVGTAAPRCAPARCPAPTRLQGEDWLRFLDAGDERKPPFQARRRTSAAATAASAARSMPQQVAALRELARARASSNGWRRDE